LLFHCCSWLVLSILRYLYIVRIKWIEIRFPDPRFLGKLSVLAVFVVFLTSFGFVFLTAFLCGWPKQKLFEMPRLQKIISVRYNLYYLKLR
jgi:hypothetical protein